LSSHINFFIINLDSNTRKCIINSLKMLNQLFNRLDQEKLKDMLDFVILKMLTVLSNVDDNEIKVLLSQNLLNIFKHLNDDKFNLYLNKFIDWLSNSEDRNMKKLALNVLVILSTEHMDNIASRGEDIKAVLLQTIENELVLFENELERKLENEDYQRVSKKNELNKLFKGSAEENEDNTTVLNVKFEDWDLLYLALNVLEKSIDNYFDIWKNNVKNDINILMMILRSFKHPHSFIKSIALRLIQKILINGGNFNNYINKLHSQTIDNNNPIQFLLINLRFMMLNSSISESMNERVIEITAILLENYVKINQDLAYEFVCRLYIESKSYMSNKEISPIIFGRIFNLVNILFERLHERELKVFLEPLLSLAYRLISNNTVAEELKNQANIVNICLTFSYLKTLALKWIKNILQQNINK
jgi:hypothetical protein